MDTKTGKTSHSDRLYISDLYTYDAEYHGLGIRQHWLIENNLHWVKDVRHNEDKNRIKTKNGPVNISTISTIALNLHRNEGRKSIKDAQTYAMVNIKQMIDEIRT